MKPQVRIDEEGFWAFGETRVSDPQVGFELFSQLTIEPDGQVKTTLQGQIYAVDHFDKPYVAQMVFFDGSQWFIQMPYQFVTAFDLQTLCVDEWDRFHGQSQKGIPFVLSRKAQNEFFNLVDSYDDDSVEFKGKTIPIPSEWRESAPASENQFWSDHYQKNETPWDLGHPAQILQTMLPRLKLPRSRVLNLGCGRGFDASLFADQGHLVTAVDFSKDALEQAKKIHAGRSVQWIHEDAFQWAQQHENQFDVVLEHTFFCAISPDRRSDLVRLWTRCLVLNGFLVAILPVTLKKGGPPFGGTQWEYRERLKKNFRFLFWGLWDEGKERQTPELFVLAQRIR